MIEDSKYKQILEDGLLLDHYYLLCKIANGEKLVQNKRVQGFINLLVKKEYIDEQDKLTEKAKLLLEKIHIEAKVEYKEDREEIKKTSDLYSFAMNLHKTLQDKIFELTGKKQAVAQLAGKNYSFLPNATDLYNVLYRVVGQYKLKPDTYPKIEKILLRYVEHCYKGKNWFPVLQYYISKDRRSSLVTALESFDENDQSDNGFKSNQKLL